MKKKLIAINACNLHVGGGVQVATSLIDELTRLDIDDMDVHVFASSVVDANLKSISAKTKNFYNYQVLDVHGLAALKPSFYRIFKSFDLTFTIFGPSYLGVQKNKHLVGFAQAGIIYKNNEAFQHLSILKKIKIRFKFSVQSLFFRRADKLVVELDHVKNGLVACGIAKADNVEIVYNCLSTLYYQPDKWQFLKIHKISEKFKIGFIGRDYFHKNTTILPRVKELLMQKHDLDVDFFVTLNQSEWNAKSDGFKVSLVNVGPLTVAQCPTFYRQMDAVIFPSLLECFSATPLEAMAMEKPLFASDCSFVRDVCADFAWYFDPMHPESAADVIAFYIREKAGRDWDRLAAARDYSINFSNARQRAEKYLKIIQKTLDIAQ